MRRSLGLRVGVAPHELFRLTDGCEFGFSGRALALQRVVFAEGFVARPLIELNLLTRDSLLTTETRVGCIAGLQLGQVRLRTREVLCGSLGRVDVLRVVREFVVDPCLLRCSLGLRVSDVTLGPNEVIRVNTNIGQGLGVLLGRRAQAVEP